MFDLPRRSAEFDLAAAVGDLVNVQAARFEPFDDDVHVFGRDSEAFSKLPWR